MFRKFFSKNEIQSRTGFFKVEKDNLIEIASIPGKGSINDCIESLGFPINHIHTVNTFDSKKIYCLGFKTLSKELVFVLAKTHETKLSFSDITNELRIVDWNFEYSSLNIEDILNEGIDSENFDLEYLKSVIDLQAENDTLFKSEKLGIYLQFENGILKAFSSSEWENSSTKWLTNLNELMVKKMKEEAEKYHDNEIDVMQEVNSHTESLLNIPQAMNNEYLPLHKKKNGNTSFYNLLVTHYTQNCKQEEFLFMNKGRYNEIDDQTFEVGNFIYTFDSEKELIGVRKK